MLHQHRAPLEQETGLSGLARDLGNLRAKVIDQLMRWQTNKNTQVFNHNGLESKVTV